MSDHADISTGLTPSDRTLESTQQPVSAHARPLVICPSDATLQEAAQAVDAARQSCALLETPAGLAIITDSDFRTAWSSGVPASSPAAPTASCPVITVPEGTPVSRAFLTMIERGVHHLVLTDHADRPVGVVRVVDLASADVRDPLVVRGAIESARTLEELSDAARLLPSTAVALADVGVTPGHFAALLAAVREALVLKAIALLSRAEATGPGAPPRTVSWLVLGSLARREPLPSSDLDTALVWDDGASGAADDEVAASVRATAARVLAGLQECGLPPCPDGANADSPLFSRSRTAWTSIATSWVSKPVDHVSLLMAAMLTDARPITELALGRQVIDSMLDAVEREILLPMLLPFTVSSRPPTGFVRDFVVEHSGEQHGRLDLKRGGLLPVAALGRWAAIVTGDDRGGTVERLRRGEAAGIFTADETDVLASAFDLFYGLLLQLDVEAIRSGRTATTYVAPAELDRLTRRYLRDAFREVSRVQSRVRTEWTYRLP